MLVLVLTGGGAPEDTPVFAWHALQQAALAWRTMLVREGVPPSMALALDLAMMSQELVGSRGGEAALSRLVKRAEGEVRAARARRRRSPVSDEGIQLVNETVAFLRHRWSPERIARQLARSTMVSPHLRVPLGLDVVLPSGDIAHSQPGEAAIERAVKAIEKHLGLRGDDDERRRVQVVVAHVLYAFGGGPGGRVSLSWARNAVGLKKK